MDYFQLDWYNKLTKPEWTPSPSTISTIWLILYPIIFISFGYIFYKVVRGKLKLKTVTPFIINIIANILFTPIQFGLKNLPLATLDILIVLITIIWLMAVGWKKYKWVALFQIPYLIWVTIATFLQIQITLANP